MSLQMKAGVNVDAKELAAYIDHTNLKPDASEADMKKLCEEAKEYGFCMVAINSVQTSCCKKWLCDSAVHVGAAISFPLGQTTIATKLFECEDALRNGADEIDYVVNLTKVKDHDYAYIEDEMRQMVALCHKYHVICKVIFENCYLNDEEKIQLCEIANRVRPDFIKTSTGFGVGGATLEDVKLMVEHVDEAIAVKAAGGIRDLDTALAMIEAGAKRIGTSSGISLIHELIKRKESC